MYSPIRFFTEKNGRIDTSMGHLILETPLEIIINGSSNTLIMFTPGMTRELVTGFLYTEGFVESLSDILDLEIVPVEKEDGEEIIEARVRLIEERVDSRVSTMRVSYSSCGICGKEGYFDLKRGVGRVKSRQRFSMAVLSKTPKALEDHQPLYDKTGGAHAAALLDTEGHILLHCEDMGRHNALDKVIGAALLKEMTCHDKILLSSGRASLEMILKTARIGIPVFVAMSRPTSRSVEAAKFYNITLVDMAKGSNRIYSHVRRIEEYEPH